MNWTEALDQQVAALLPDLLICADEPMKAHTSLRVGGPARRMAFPATGEQLISLLHIANDCKANPLVIGNGSNLLTSDDGLDCLVIDTSRQMKALRRDGEEIVAAAGVLLPVLADFARKESLSGLEFAHGIPGTVGGAMVMNAGAYGGEMKDVVRDVTVYDPERGVVTLSPEKMAFSYRHSVLSDHPEWTVLHATFALHPEEVSVISARMQEMMEKRKASQPYDQPTAGSTFQRPKDGSASAGELIDRCGLKGMRIGGAEVSRKHANFIVNTGDASAEDVFRLIETVRQTVERETGVLLTPEVKMIR